MKSLEGDPDSSLIKVEEKNLGNQNSEGKSEEKISDVKKEGDNLNDILNNVPNSMMSPKNGSSKRPYNKKTMEKIKRWTKEESGLYEQFIEMYADIFNDPSSKRVTKIFIFMSKYIGSKTPSQCRSHHQKFFKKIQGMKTIGSMNNGNANTHLQRNKEGLEELNKFQNSEKKKRGKYSKKTNVNNISQNNEEINKNLNPFDFPFDENLKMQFKHQFENDPTGSFLAYPGMFNLNSFSQNNRPGQDNLMNMYSQLNNNIRKSFEMLNKEYNNRKPQGIYIYSIISFVFIIIFLIFSNIFIYFTIILNFSIILVNDERELLNMFSNPNQRKPNNMPYFFNNSNNMEPSDFNNFEKVLNSTQYFNQNPSFPPLFPGIPPQVNPYNFPNNLTTQINQNMPFNPNQMVQDPTKLNYDPNQKNEENQQFFQPNQFQNWVVGNTAGIPNGVFANGGNDFDLNFLKNRGLGGFQNAGIENENQMKYGGKVENIDNMETYLKSLTKYF